MVTTFALPLFQFAFVFGFLGLAGVFALLLKVKRLFVIAVVIVVLLLIVHYVVPVASFIAHR